MVPFLLGKAWTSLLGRTGAAPVVPYDAAALTADVSARAFASMRSILISGTRSQPTAVKAAEMRISGVKPSQS